MEQNLKIAVESFLKDYSFENGCHHIVEMVSAINEDGSPAGMVAKISLVKFANVFNHDETENVEARIDGDKLVYILKNK